MWKTTASNELSSNGSERASPRSNGEIRIFRAELPGLRKKDGRRIDAHGLPAAYQLRKRPRDCPGPATDLQHPGVRRQLEPGEICVAHGLLARMRSPELENLRKLLLDGRVGLGDRGVHVRYGGLLPTSDLRKGAYALQLPRAAKPSSGSGNQRRRSNLPPTRSRAGASAGGCASISATIRRASSR